MSNQKEYDVLVYIGRFQPIHLGHIDTLKRAASMAKKIVVVVGSSYRPRSYKNPFTFDERSVMIRQAAQEANLDVDIRIEATTDALYDDTAWMAQVQAAVNTNLSGLDKKIGLIGHKKDQSTEYLDWFPQWERVYVPLFEPIDATQIRDLYFREQVATRFVASVVPQRTMGFLEVFSQGEDFKQLVRERTFLEKLKAEYAALKYPPHFITTDAVVIQAGHVLLIKRRAEPGKGLWAFPGGYLQADLDKDLVSCMLRELREETGLKVPEKVLRGSIKDQKVFDAIGRSERGRIVTHAFKIVLTDGEWNLPKVKGMDDAEKAKWFPIAEVKSEMMFEDHWDLFTYFIRTV